MISSLRRHQALSRLALLAAVLLCAWQSVNAQHIHADEQETACEICAASNHDDDATLERTSASPQPPAAAISHTSLATCHRTVSEYSQGPRAPPAS